MTNDDLAARMRAWTLQGEEPDVGDPPVPDTVVAAPAGSGDDLPAYAERSTDGSRSTRNRSWVTRAAILVPVLGVTGALVFGAAQRSDAPDLGSNGPATSLVAPTTTWKVGPCDPPESTSRNPTPEEAAASNAAAEETTRDIERHGFARTRGHALDGTYVCGWVNINRLTMDDMRAGPPDPEPIYDAPNGNLMGYAYRTLGYVSVEQAQSPGFDPARLRIERYGCDPVTDAGCKPPTTWTGRTR